MTTTEGTVTTNRTLSGNSYQAEILRHVHDRYGGHLQDTDIGISRRLWNELGQTAGCHFASVSAALSALENDGRVVTEFGIRAQGGRCRTSILLVEEPPEGFTVYKGQLVRRAQEQPVPTDGKPPTAEEIANWLLKKTVEAAQVPVFDLIAARHHAECLQEDVAAWQELAAEYEERLIQLRQQLEEQRHVTISVMDTPQDDTAVLLLEDEVQQLTTELRRVTQHRDDARRDLARIRQLLHQTQERVQELETENATLHGRISTALEEEEARQLRQKVYGLERSLEESRRANRKAEDKIVRQAQVAEELNHAVADANLAMHEAQRALVASQERLNTMRDTLALKSGQLNFTTQRLMELQCGGDYLSEEEREFVDRGTAALHDMYQFDHTPTEAEIRAILVKHQIGESARAAGVTESVLDFPSLEDSKVEITLPKERN